MVAIGIQFNFTKQHYSGLAKTFNESGYSAFGLDKDEILKNPSNYVYTRLNDVLSLMPIRYLDKWKCNTLGDYNLDDFKGIPKKVLSTSAFVTKAKPGQEHFFAIWLPVTKQSFVHDYLLAHELGHIIFGHLFLRFDSKDLLIQEVENNKSEILQAISEVVEEMKKELVANSGEDVDTSNLDLSEKDLDSIVKNLPYAIKNLLTDCEINSKLFTQQEFIQLTALAELEKHVFQFHFEDKGEGKEKSVVEKRDGYNLFGVHPSQLGFPEGLSYHDYVILLLKDFKKYIKAILQLLQGGGCANLKEEVEKASTDLGTPSDSDNKGDKDKTRGDTGSAKAITLHGDNLINLKKYIRVVREDQGYFKDPLFNYNRGRSKDVLIPRVRRNITKGSTESVLTSLVDVSGSMDEKKIMGLCESINATSVKKKVTALWNTSLVSEIINDIPSDINIGGGTDLAPGIKWIAENHPQTVQLFIMSDFEDDLDSIRDALLQLKRLKNLVFVVVDDSSGSMEKEIRDTIISKLSWADSTIVRVI
ncbi:TPA: hypothetical protein SFZ51_000848 [Campylobacter jejuni]|nr:hypothetical protein [Campylobacter jejuni]HEG8105066.1 hypothetical protein [Campylobacter jejuni]HEG8133970.1 hypothetical protein [Campylobacter jejuni]